MGQHVKTVVPSPLRIWRDEIERSVAGRGVSRFGGERRDTARHGMGLSAEQLKLREGRLGASEVGPIMRGEADRILQLWRIKIGEELPPDLSNNWPVALGTHTESLSLDWHERRDGADVTRRGEVVLHPTEPFAATLDGVSSDLREWDEIKQGLPPIAGPCDAKHVGGREPLEVTVARYWPQMAMQMWLTGYRRAGLHIIRGADEPRMCFLDHDDAYCTELLMRCRQFMAHVAARTPPVALPAVPVPPERMRTVDMSASNAWCARAADAIACKQARDTYVDAERELKAMVAADVKRAHGGGVQITRDKRGYMSLRIDG